MTIRLKTLGLGFAILGSLALAGNARAGLLPTTTVIEQTATGSSYKYSVVATSDVRVEPGQSFTIYDFAGFTGVTEQPAGWVLTTSTSGPVYSGVTPPDDAGLVNLTWTWSGSTAITTPTPGSNKQLGIFQAFSSFTGAGSVGDGWFTSVTDRDTDGVEEYNITKVTKPIDPGTTGGGEDPDPETPEPASLALLALGLPAAALRRRLLAKKSA